MTPFATGLVFVALIGLSLGDDSSDCSKTASDLGIDLLDLHNLVDAATHAMCSDGVFGNYDRKPVLIWLVSAFTKLYYKFDLNGTKSCGAPYEITRYNSKFECAMLTYVMDAVKVNSEKAAKYAEGMCKYGCEIPAFEVNIVKVLLAETKKYLSHQFRRVEDAPAELGLN
ncbi:hypothetical protein L596_008927 [Steinernema carpocapsae]|uniref:SCP domain-containing protein n=1 Tax=Steinernema carpocapsae TaxID=34508 RepID=A0A4U5PDV9_STECR|nr:hypothetical protein L596_008927 [Steinernema carpocapsae]